MRMLACRVRGPLSDAWRAAVSLGGVAVLLAACGNSRPVATTADASMDATTLTDATDVARAVDTTTSTDTTDAMDSAGATDVADATDAAMVTDAPDAADAADVPGDTALPPGDACADGGCGLVCTGGTTACVAVCGSSSGSSVCVNTLTDATNCGGCGVQCAGWSCQSGICQDPSNGTLSGFIVAPRADWLFWVRDNGEPPWTGMNLATAATTYDLGATSLTASAGDSVGTIAEWDYSCLRIPNGSTDGSGLPRATFPCFGPLQGCPAPVSEAEAFSRLHAYYDARLAALPAHSKILSTTGHFFFQHYGAEWGASMIQSEVGENINSTQTHIAFSRGAAKQYGLPWGLDMSSWYGPGNRDWTVPGIWGSASCPTCGHSLSLAERTYFAAYMAGANFMEDEGGSFNFFLGNTTPLELSPLGQVAQTANQFANAYVDRGTPYVPIAIVMDHNHGMGLGWWETNLTWDTFPLDASRQFTKSLFQTIWPQSFSVGWSLPGADESQYMVPSPYGDSFDVLLENAPTSLFANYRAIVLTGDVANTTTMLAALQGYVMAGGVLVLDSTSPAAPYVSGIVGTVPSSPLGTLTAAQAVQYTVGSGVVVLLRDMTQWNQVLSIVSYATSPFTISGSAEYMFNQRGSSWVVTLINDLGVTKTPLVEEVTTPSMAQTLTVTARGGTISNVVPWRGTAATQPHPNQFTVTVPAGDIGVYQFDGSCVPSPIVGPLLMAPPG